MIIMIKTKRVLDIGVDSEDKKVKSNNIGILHQLMIMNNNKVVYCQSIHVNDSVNFFKIKHT